MSDTELLRNVRDSYDDFVNSTIRWMNRDANTRTKILDQLSVNPESTTSDILKGLCDHLGIGEPLELIDDDSIVDVGDMQAVVQEMIVLKRKRHSEGCFF